MANQRDAEKHLRRERAQRAALDFVPAANLAAANGMTLRRLEDYAYELSGTGRRLVPSLSLPPISETHQEITWVYLLYPTTFRIWHTKESGRAGPKVHYLRPGWRLLDVVQLATAQGQQEAAAKEQRQQTQREQLAMQEFPIAHDLAADSGMVLSCVADRIGPRYSLAGCPSSCWVAMPERRWELRLFPRSCQVAWESNDQRFRAKQGMQVMKAIELHEEWTLMLAVEVAATVVTVTRMEVART